MDKEKIADVAAGIITAVLMIGVPLLIVVGIVKLGGAVVRFYGDMSAKNAAAKEAERQQMVDAFYDEGSKYCIEYSESGWGKSMTIYSEACNQDER